MFCDSEREGEIFCGSITCEISSFHPRYICTPCIDIPHMCFCLKFRIYVKLRVRRFLHAHRHHHHRITPASIAPVLSPTTSLSFFYFLFYLFVYYYYYYFFFFFGGGGGGGSAGFWMDVRVPDAVANTVNGMVRHYLREAPDAPYVSLSGCGIADMDPLLPSLTQLRQMLSLDLSNNHIVSLPSGIDLAACMPQLRALDLSSNLLDVREGVVQSLLPLRQLRSLRLDLSNDEDVWWVARCLPQLSVVNGVEVNSSVCRKFGAESEGLAQSPSLEVACLPKMVHPHGAPLESYRRLLASLQALQRVHEKAASEVQHAESNDDVDLAVHVDKESAKGLTVTCSASAPIQRERKLFSCLFQEAVEATEALAHAEKDDAQRLNGFLGDTARVLRELYRCHGRLESRLVSTITTGLDDEGGRMKLQQELEGDSTTRGESRLGYVDDHPRFSLLSLLRLIQIMVWSKQRREEERRRGRSWNGCFYYETMRQHMFTFFVEQYPHALETQIVAHVMEFIYSLKHYANIENCVEAYVFACILDGTIEESYWSLFESLCTTIGDVIEHVAHLDLGVNAWRGMENVEKQQQLCSRHSTHHGFLCKEHVFHVIDVLVPVTQRDSLLHVDLVETALSLLSAPGDEEMCRHGPIITASCLLRGLCGVFVRRHEYSIFPITRAFQTVVGDAASVGVVTVVQLRDILHLLGLPGAETPEFFTHVHAAVSGPFGDAPITFSAIVEAIRQLLQGNPAFT